MHCLLFIRSLQRCELTEHWIVEGFLNSSGSIEEAIGSGYDFLGTLHVSCLLEKLNSNAFKMHDVNRHGIMEIASQKKLNLFAHHGNIKMAKETAMTGYLPIGFTYQKETRCLIHPFV